MSRAFVKTLARLKGVAGVRPSRRPSLMPSIPGPGLLTELRAFGDNPGALRAWTFVPEGVARPPLVVVLHGCTQTAAGYDLGSGWSALAERHGFALLLPEQQRANNANLCFNWFRPQDTGRGGGEAASIRAMIAALVDRAGVDADRIFVTGLSAGGAMTSVMLATYPELFAGGAIIAGLPYGAAQSLPQALDRMRGNGHVDDRAASALVRGASDHRGRWPRIAVWHGTADATVAPVNADAIVGQWRALHSVAREPDETDLVDGFPHRVWRGADGGIAIEDYRITGMGHGTPLAVDGQPGGGRATPHMLDVGIASTRHIAAGWGLLEDIRPLAIDREPPARSVSSVPLPSLDPPAAAPVSSVQHSIEVALRNAGLMR